MAMKELPYSLVSEKGQQRASISLGKDGWISRKNTTFPQQLLLRFPRPYLVKKVLIQAHHIYIPKRVEIFLGNGRMLNGIPAPPRSPVQFRKIGEINFKDNSQTYYKGREKGAVSIEEIGVALKLVMSHNHQNQFNLQNQIALTNITVLGELYDPKRSASVRSNRSRGNPSTRPSSTSPNSKENDEKKKDQDEDLVALDRNPAIQIRTVIRILKARKEEAIVEDDFLDAKQLQGMLEILKEGEEELNELNDKKRAAIKVDDMGKAEVCKREMQRVRDATLRKLPNIGKHLTPAEKKALNYVDAPPSSNDEARKHKPGMGHDVDGEEGDGYRKMVDDGQETGYRQHGQGPSPHDYRADLPTDDVGRTPATLDRHCKFCGEQNDEFTAEGILAHYKKSCPVLTKCPYCSRVVETKKLHSHYRIRCPFLRGSMVDCPKCHIPVGEEALQNHLVPNSTHCNGRPPPLGGEYCPLCDKVVMVRQPVAWPRHLIGQRGCVGNTRRNKVGVNKIRVAAGPAPGGYSAPGYYGNGQPPRNLYGHPPNTGNQNPQAYNQRRSEAAGSPRNRNNKQSDKSGDDNENDKQEGKDSKKNKKKDEKDKKGKKGKKGKDDKETVKEDGLDPKLDKLLKGVDLSFGAD